MTFLAEINQTVPAAIISAAGGILATYLTLRYRPPKYKKPDRVDTIFDGYEKLIRQQQSDIDRKSKQLDSTQIIIDRLQVELESTKEIVNQQRRELEVSKETNSDLIKQLDAMRSKYST